MQVKRADVRVLIRDVPEVNVASVNELAPRHTHALVEAAAFLFLVMRFPRYGQTRPAPLLSTCGLSAAHTLRVYDCSREHQ